MPAIRSHRLIICFLLLWSGITEGQVSHEVEGQSSIILDNNKDIDHTSNSWYKQKLIQDATINAIRQAVPTLVNIREYSYQNFDEADKTKQPTDQMIFQFKSGKQVQWRQSGNPVITPDLRTKRKWNCSVSGYAKEMNTPVVLNAPQAPVDPAKINKQPGSGCFGLGYGLSLPQVFNVPLTRKLASPMPEWQLTVYPIHYAGFQAGISKELYIGFYFSYTTIKLLYDSLETRNPCYGGRVQFGLYRRSVNPYIAFYALYGEGNSCAFAIKGAAIGIDFLKGRFKFGIDAMAYWVSSNIEHDGTRFSDNVLFDLNDGFNLNDLRFNLGVGLKLYFF